MLRLDPIRPAARPGVSRPLVGASLTGRRLRAPALFVSRGRSCSPAADRAACVPAYPSNTSGPRL